MHPLSLVTLSGDLATVSLIFCYGNANTICPVVDDIVKTGIILCVVFSWVFIVCVADCGCASNDFGDQI